MPCYHPLKAYRSNAVVEDKRKIVFVKEHNISEEDCAKYGYEPLKIPCGQCLGCRLEYSRQWAMRCYFEAKQYDHNYFVTLTYDNDHLPVTDHVQFDKDTGEVVSSEVVSTLVPRDLQLFLKRLRTTVDREYGHQGIRFFACGEYGPQNMRPHYHLILFNLPLYDLKLLKIENGNAYYRSALLERIWNKGYIVVTEFSFSTAGYVARYMLKKHKGFDADFYEKRGLYPEFTRCSRRPGIGREYYELNKDSMYQFDEVFIPQRGAPPLKCKPPKYFDTLFGIENPEDMEYTKERRKDIAISRFDRELSQTDLQEDAYLSGKESNKLLSIRKLKRSV